MNTDRARLPSGGRINRQKPLRFEFDGTTMHGYQGDTLASALLANDISLIGRSFRYHRPRGIMTAGPEEPHALVTIGSGASHEPNVRATTQVLYDGLKATSQNCWPSPKLDLGAVPGWLSHFLPAGFYYKTFLWPNWSWYEGFIRRMAGLGTAPTASDPDRYEKRFAHCDVLVVGGGASGIAAALKAAQAGSDVILVDEQVEFGGSSLWAHCSIDSKMLSVEVTDMLASLKTMNNVRLLLRTCVVAAYDHNSFTAVETVDRVVRQRLWRIRSQRTVLATGGIERPLVFPNNDRPGIMLASAARQYVNRYAVRPGKVVVIFTNNDSAYRAAIDLHGAGVLVEAVIDIRQSVTGQWPQEVRDLGIRILPGHAVLDTRGYMRLRAVDVAPLDSEGRISARTLSIDCDLLCMSGGWTPTVHLLSQAGGKLKYDPDRVCFVPAILPDGVQVKGAATGDFDAEYDLIRQPSQAYWQTSGRKPGIGLGKQWVDFLHDVTTTSIEQSVREGFTSVEHLKRYTTIGMAADQGMTSNVNALAILSELTDRDISSVGTTTFRPPYQSVTLGCLAGREIGSLASPQRRLPMHDWHTAAGGIMEDHGGWQRAACYRRSGETEKQAIRREVFAVRHHVGLLDSSSLGKIEVSGPDAAEFLNRIYVNSVKTLKPGRVRYGLMLNENGVIQDDGVFARISDTEFLISTSSAGLSAVTLALEEWLQCEWPELQVVIQPVTTQWAVIAVTGPKSRALISELITDTDLSADSFPHMSIRSGKIGHVDYRLMRVSFTGELSFELSIPTTYAWSIWQQLLDAGAKQDVTAIGMEALDILRLEKGFLEVGVDTDVATTPLDVGWGAPIARKKADFVGKRSLTRRDNLRTDRLQLVGLEFHKEDLPIPVGSHLLDRETKASEGHVTSSCISPTLGCSIAMAMLESGHARQGDTVFVDVDHRLFGAEVVPLTFYDPKGERLNESISY